jgi:transcriptional regulator with XRE-family HTH domain
MNYAKLTSDQIKARLAQNDILYADIAAALEVSPSLISSVANSNGKSYRVATALGLPLNLVFGDKYNETTKTRRDRSARRLQVIRAIKNGTAIPPTSALA